MSMDTIIWANKIHSDLYGYKIVGEEFDWKSKRWEPILFHSEDGYPSEESVIKSAKYKLKQWNKTVHPSQDEWYRGEHIILYRYSVTLHAEVELDERGNDL